MNLRLWLVKETEKARLYSRQSSQENSSPTDLLWLPRSVCKSTKKFPPTSPTAWPEHHVEVEEWFAEKEKL